MRVPSFALVFWILLGVGLFGGCGGQIDSQGAENPPSLVQPQPNPGNPSRPPIEPPNIFASRVIAADDKGRAGGGIFNPANALGAPLGNGLFLGGTNVHSLGVGGWLTLGFDVLLTNGPGADFIVAENAFLCNPALTGFCPADYPSDTFSEAAYVEVSSDGEHFARFPSRYYGADADSGFLTRVGSFENLAGSSPVLLGSADFPDADPQNIVEAGGDAFDLEDLTNDPLVINNQVDLHSITQIRLVDVQAGVDVDSRGIKIWDNSSSADIDDITVINHTQNQNRNAPVVDIFTDALGVLNVVITDRDADLDYGTFKIAVFGVPMADSLSSFAIEEQTPATFRAKLDHSQWPDAYSLRLGVSIVDQEGHLGSAQRSRVSL